MIDKESVANVIFDRSMWLVESDFRRRIVTLVTTLTTTQHNLNTLVGLDKKITVQTPPHHTNSTAALMASD